jgi:hypothetical protein
MRLTCVCASGFFASVTVSTPFLKAALTFVKLKTPQRRASARSSSPEHRRPGLALRLRSLRQRKPHRGRRRRRIIVVIRPAPMAGVDPSQASPALRLQPGRAVKADRGAQ